MSWALSLVSPVAFSLSISELLLKEASSHGAQWSNVTISETGVFTIQGALVMLFVDILLYFTLGFYLNRVVPTEYGIARSWYVNCICAFSQAKQVVAKIRDSLFRLRKRANARDLLA